MWHLHVSIPLPVTLELRKTFAGQASVGLCQGRVGSALAGVAVLCKSDVWGDEPRWCPQEGAKDVALKKEKPNHLCVQCLHQVFVWETG